MSFRGRGQPVLDGHGQGASAEPRESGAKRKGGGVTLDAMSNTASTYYATVAALTPVLLVTSLYFLRRLTRAQSIPGKVLAWVFLVFMTGGGVWNLGASLGALGDEFPTSAELRDDTFLMTMYLALTASVGAVIQVAPRRGDDS